MISVLIVDDHPGFRREMKQLLGTVDEIRIVGEAENGSQALKLFDDLKPDVVLIDQKMPGLSGVSVTYQIKARWPDTRVIFVAAESSARKAALEAGAEFFFVKGDDTSDLIKVILKPLSRRGRSTNRASGKKAQPLPLANSRLWKTVGIGFSLLILSSMIFFPHISLPVIALIFGMFFFVYGLKYYGSAALILVATSGIGNNNANGNGNGLNGVFNGMAITNGLNRDPSMEKPGLVRSVIRRILGREPNGFANGFRDNDGNNRLRNANGINGNGFIGNGFRYHPSEQPFISIQLPMYNETRVVDRLLEACTRLDYQNYEILVADDSADETLVHLEKWAKHPKVRVSHRINRTGFKGAALKHAVEVMDPRTEFVVVFDADFIPPPNILHQFLIYFYGVNGVNGNNQGNQNGEPLELIDESLAVVQGYQWHVLNASENWITRGIRTEFSGSYVVERPGQELTGGMKMISGSVFMIRADLLRDIGWGTSITEDWELTIRLYLEGYRVLYSPFIQAPAECVSDFKQLARQRMRWSEGHTFNVKKYFSAVLRSPRLTRREKLEFLYYVPYYLQSVLFIIGTASWFISELILRSRLPFWTETLGWSLVFANTFALILMNTAGLFLERGIRRNIGGLLSFVLLTFLLVPYQAYAAVKGLLEPHEGGWHRTDKTGVITDVIDKIGLGKRMRRLAPKKKKRRGIDLGRRLGAPAAKLTRLLPEPLKRFTRRHGLAFRVMSSLIIGLILLAILASQVPISFAAPDVFYLRDTTSNGASPAGEDMNNTQGTSEDTMIFNSTDDEAYWYTEVSYPTGGDDASVAAGNYTLNMYFNQLPGAWWDTDYKYRQQITITAGSSAVPSGYAVSASFNHANLVTNSKSQSDGDDIRIVYWTGSGWSELDRALQEGSSWNNASTIVWFKTQTAISASGSDNNYYLYYGNTSAVSPPDNKSNIYSFWDDFNDSSLGAGWSLDAIGTVSGGSTNESGTVVTISATNTGDIWSTADDAYHLARSATGNFVAESYTTGVSGSHHTWSKYGGVHLRDTTAAGSKNANMSEVYSAVGATFSYRVATNGTTSETTSSNRYDYNRIIRDGGTAEGYQSNDGITWSQLDGTITFTGGLSDPVRIGPILAAISSTSHSVDVDWFKIRPFVDPEPTTGFGSEVDAPYVQIVVSVYHTDSDGSDPTEIVTSSTVTIDANTADPYALLIGNGAEQTFTSSDPQRLRVHIDVTAVNGSGSFTFAYDSAANHSSLDTPSMTVHDVTMLLLVSVYLIPILTGLITRKRRLALRFLSVITTIFVSLAILATRVVPASAEVTETTNTFWFYDDTTPQQYMMYQTQPSGSETSETTTTINFYSDTFADNWEVNAGTTTVYMVVSTGFDIDWVLTLYAGTTGDWTNLGSTNWSIPIGGKQLRSTSFSTSSYTFSSGDRLRLEVQIAFGGTAYWDGSSNDSRMVTPTLVVPEWGLLFMLMVPLIPAVMAVFWRKRRLANHLVSILLAAIILVGMVAVDVEVVRAAPDTFYLHDTNTSGTAITLDATSSNTALNTSSISWSHTIGSGNHRKLIVGICVEEDVLGDEPVTSVTYNSVSLTYANHVTAGSGPLQRVEVWYLDEADLPSTGAYTIQVNTTGTVQEINAGAASINEARAGAPEATATNTNFNSASITTNITTLTDGAGVIDVVGSGNGGTFTPGAGQSELWDVSASNATGAMSGKLVASAGLTSMQQTHSTTSNRNAHVLIAVAPHDPDVSPSGKYMNTTEGSAGSTMTFDTATQSAYWYVDETWPTGNDNATIAAGDYTFNMYFNTLPTWYDTDWDCRKKITIDATRVPGDLTNFPVLVNLNSDSDLASGAQGDADDILFTTSNGTTKVSHEIEYFNSTSGALVAWVELPSVSGSSNTDFYMYYCNSGASNQEDVANTWTDTYVAVQHLAESTGTQTDSTGRGNSGTLNGTTTFDSSSQIDGGRDFDGSSGNISIGNSTDINTGGPYTDRTITLWFNADSTTGRQVIYEEGAQVRGFMIYIDSGSLYVGGWNTPSGESNWSGTWHSTTISANTWYHVTLLLTGGTSTVQPNVFRAYLDASSIGSGNGSQVWAHSGDIRTARSGGNTLYHDGQSSAANYFDGTVDEWRVSNQTISTNWITAEYNNQSSPSTFYTLSSEEVEPTVDITVSVHHTKPDGSDAQAIVTSSSTEINCDTVDPYALSIGTGLLQTFTSSNPRRLRLRVYVDSVSGGGSFTLDYDGTCASSRCSNLDTPVVVVPEASVAWIPVVFGVPMLVSMVKRRKRKRSES